VADSDTITGQVEPGFDVVRDAFAANFEQGRELGAAFCVHLEGRKVVDLYGGSFDRARTGPYGPEALQLVFSTTKGATAICANLLAQRGLLDMDEVFASVGFTLEQKTGLGFWRSSPVTLFGGEGSFGHGGAGGSYGFADPEHGLAVGYVMNKMAMEFSGDARSHGLIGALYEAIGARPKYF
jgi:CubicO group peptidase (beta-lactamase class C family)